MPFFVNCSGKYSNASAVWVTKSVNGGRGERGRVLKCPIRVQLMEMELTNMLERRARGAIGPNLPWHPLTSL